MSARDYVSVYQGAVPHRVLLEFEINVCKQPHSLTRCIVPDVSTMPFEYWMR